MLGTKSGVEKLLKDKFPEIILWHCLNHRLELAVENTLKIISGTNDFQSSFQHLYSLYSQPPKNKRKLSIGSPDFQMTLKSTKKVFTGSLHLSGQDQQSCIFSQLLSQHFHKVLNDERYKVQKRPHFKDYYLNNIQQVLLQIYR